MTPGAFAVQRRRSCSLKKEEAEAVNTRSSRSLQSCKTLGTNTQLASPDQLDRVDRRSSIDAPCEKGDFPMPKTHPSAASRRRGTSILVLVHPYATASGPIDNLEAISKLVEDWDGNVYVLADRGGNPLSSLQGSHFLDVLFDRTAAAEDRGEIRRLFADEDFGELADAIEHLADLTPNAGDYTITGASMEGACTTVARGLAELGLSAVIDSTAITADDRAVAAICPTEDDTLMRQLLGQEEDAEA